MENKIMKIWNWLKKKLWYILLLGASTIYVVYYRASIYQLEKMNARSLIFLLWLGLLLLPLFSEMEFFGVKVKREVEAAKSEMKEYVHEKLLQQIQLQTIQNSSKSDVNLSIYQGPVKSIDEIKELKDEIDNKRAPETTSKIPDQTSPRSSRIPDQQRYLRHISETIEVHVKELCHMTGCNKMGIPACVDHLMKNNIISGQTFDWITQTMRIANRSMLHELIQTPYMEFVEKAFPEIISQLDKEKKLLKPVNCARCHFEGYSKYDNSCPRCGYTWDDE